MNRWKFLNYLLHAVLAVLMLLAMVYLFVFRGDVPFLHPQLRRGNQGDPGIMVDQRLKPQLAVRSNLARYAFKYTLSCGAVKRGATSQAKSENTAFAPVPVGKPTWCWRCLAFCTVVKRDNLGFTKAC
jgi:hypothetical protein